MGDSTVTLTEVPKFPSMERMRQILDDEVQWCCKGRHGALLNLDPDDKDGMNEYFETLEYFFAATPDQGVWIKLNADGTISLEFIHQAKVYPPPERPEEWCGKSILF